MQRIIDICDSRVKLEALRGIRNPYARNDDDDNRFSSFALCIDGTSAARKTTILARTGMPIRKVQRFVTVRNADTYYPSMIGYIAAGINRQNTGGQYYLNDRSYLNTLEWCLLWRLMDDYAKRKGNTNPLDREAPDAQERAELVESYRRAFRDLAASYHYRLLRRKFYALAFIDTNVQRCDELRAKRNEGNDRERSAWRFYTPMQNLMYETLYPKAHIDMAWFDDDEGGDNNCVDDDIDLVTNSLAVWINRLCGRLSRRHHTVPIVPHSRFHLPMANPQRDYTLRNMEVHVYRTFGRMAARKIADDATTKKTMRQIIPDYVGIDNIPDMLDIDDDDDDDDDENKPAKRLRAGQDNIITDAATTTTTTTTTPTTISASSTTITAASLDECFVVNDDD